MIPRLLIGSAAAVAMTGCASGSPVSSLSQPSAAPTVYTMTGSPTGPVSPEPMSTTTTIWSPPPAATSPVGCQSGVVAIANVWYNADGSQTATITAANAGAFAASTDSLDNLAQSQHWTLHITVRQ